jgi:hypothetical protein
LIAFPSWAYSRFASPAINVMPCRLPALGESNYLSRVSFKGGVT